MWLVNVALVLPLDLGWGDDGCLLLSWGALIAVQKRLLRGSNTCIQAREIQAKHDLLHAAMVSAVKRELPVDRGCFENGAWAIQNCGTSLGGAQR